MGAIQIGPYETAAQKTSSLDSIRTKNREHLIVLESVENLAKTDVLKHLNLDL